MEVVQLEHDIAKQFGRRYALLTGRAATAIYLSLATLEKGEVILPTFLCSSPAYVTLLAGHEPVFVDSDETYNMDPAAVERAMTQKTRAIIAVHMFGACCDMDKICDMAKRKGVLVIEDAAQAPGAMYKERSAGSLGDISVFSFGATKILDAEEGGAFLTDDETLFRKAQAGLRSLQRVANPPYGEFSSKVKELRQAGALGLEAQKRLAEEYKHLFLHTYDQSHLSKLSKVLSSLQENLAAREKAALLLQQNLNALEFQPSAPGRVYHRLACLAPTPKLRDVIVSALRARGRWVGTLYPPLHKSFQGTRDTCETAEQVSEKVLNFILDEQTLAREPLEETIKIVHKAIQ